MGGVTASVRGGWRSVRQNVVDRASRLHTGSGVEGGIWGGFLRVFVGIEE